MRLSSLLYHEGYYSGNKLMSHILSRCEKQIDEADKIRNAISSAEELETYAREMRDKFSVAMGDIPYDPSFPLNSKTIGVIHEELLNIEKVIFQARPSVYITANLYIPHKRRQPCGAVLFIPGHDNAGKAYSNYQKVIRAIVSAGLIVLSIDPFGQGERHPYVDAQNGKLIIESCSEVHQLAGHQVMLTGQAPVRYFIADARRAVDYLLTRDEVDPNAIGVTGSSGGGTMTCNMMVCEPRIKAAAPGTFVSSRRSILRDGRGQDAEQIWMGNENFSFDHADVFACFAPKPCLALVVDADFFPIEGTIETINSAKRLYSLYGAENSVNMTLDHSTHAYTQILAAKAASFFAMALNNEERSVVSSAVKSISNENLLCTESGHVMLEYSDAKFMFDENTEVLKHFVDSLNSEDIGEFVRTNTYRFRKPVPLHIREYPMQYANDDSSIVEQTYFWFTQEELPNFGFILRDKNTLNTKLPLKVCLFENGSNAVNEHEEVILKFIDDGYAVFVLDISGFGKCTPEFHYNALRAINVLTKDLFFIGDSLAALRLYDLERLTEVLEAIPNIGEMSIYADGNIGILAELYKLMHNDIEIEVVNSQSISDIVLNRLYDNKNVSGYMIPGIAPYFLKAKS